MKFTSYLISAGLFLAACQSNSTTPAATSAVPAPAQPAQTQAAPANSEHIDPAMVSVMGSPRGEVSIAQLTRQLGRPDSVAKGAVECGSSLSLPMNAPDGDIWYYGKTTYEVNGSRAVLIGFDVTSGKFQGKIGKLVLDKNTTLEDVRRFFPVSAKEAEKPAGPGRSGKVVSLPLFDKDVPLDDALDLLFQNGRLQAVEFFSPC